MGCPGIYNLSDLIFGIFLIIGFFRKANPIIGNSYYGLSAGFLLLGTSLLQLLSGMHLEFLELLAMLIFTFTPERVLTADRGKGLLYASLVSIVLLTLLVVLVKKDVEYFRMGTLLTISMVTVRMYLHPEVTGRGMEEPLAFSSVSSLLGAIVLVLGFSILSSFMYFAGILFLLMVMAEKTVQLRAWARSQKR